MTRFAKLVVTFEPCGIWALDAQQLEGNWIIENSRLKPSPKHQKQPCADLCFLDKAVSIDNICKTPESPDSPNPKS